MRATRELMSRADAPQRARPRSDGELHLQRDRATSTPQFPAVAARDLGLNRVPLLCTQEIEVPGRCQRVIRVLLHYYAADGHERPARVPAARRASCATICESAQ